MTKFENWKTRKIRKFEIRENIQIRKLEKTKIRNFEK